MQTDTLDGGGHYRPQLRSEQYWAAKNRADFESTNRRCDAETAAWEAVNAPARQWEDEPTSRPVFAKRGLRGDGFPDDEPADDDCTGCRAVLIRACTLVTVLTLAVAFRLLVWDALTLEGRVVAGCLVGAVAVWWWRERTR